MANNLLSNLKTTEIHRIDVNFEISCILSLKILIKLSTSWSSLFLILTNILKLKFTYIFSFFLL